MTGRLRSLAFDTAVVLSVLAAAWVPRERDHAASLATTAAALPWFAVCAALLLLRRRFPAPVVLLCAAIVVAATAAGVRSPGLILPVAIGMFGAAARCPGRTTLAIAVPLAVLLPVDWYLAVVTRTSPVVAAVSAGVLQPAVTIAFATAFGVAVRANRAALAAAVDRARRAELSREAETSRRVAEERVAIARDLHDSIGHRIAVINLHAGVAAGAVEHRPLEAAAAIAVIGESARSVMTELQTMLWLLRAPAGDDPAADPGAERVDGLLGVFARSGVPVEVERRGDVVTMPAQVGAVLYRVVQEGLTNALKHGDRSSVHLLLERRDGELLARLTNPVPAGAGPTGSAGHGLTGMRERVAAVGGSLRSGRESDVFVLEAVLPVAAATATAAVPA